MFMRNEKGQSALEYAALITVLAGIIFFFLNGTMKNKITAAYQSSENKVTKSTGWLDNSMGGN